MCLSHASRVVHRLAILKRIIMNLLSTLTLKKQQLPVAQVPSFNIQCTLKDASGTVVTSAMANESNQASFGNVPDGTYTVSAVRISMAGTPMGDTAESDPIEVVNTHEVDVPATVVVTVA
jgi:putative exporter of polyketide antibiotics